MSRDPGLAPLNFADFRQAAQRRLPRGIFEYLDRGAEDEVSIDHNRAALDAIKLQPRVLAVASPRDRSTTLFGDTVKSPVVVAPTAFAGMLWHRGEIALARAAEEAGMIFCAATEAITSVEDIARSVTTKPWFQLYLWNNHDLSRALIDQAWEAGSRTLVVTVDTPVSPKREYNVRNHFGVPLRLTARNTVDVLRHPGWLLNVLLKYFMQGGTPTFANYPPAYRHSILDSSNENRIRHEPALSWDHIDMLRRHWRGNFVIKGILRADDARRAHQHGADGIVVSNHGGRNLDSAVSTAEVLPRIADAVGGDMTVLCDSGVQRGSDVVKLLALGADAVMVGRAFLYATAWGGQAGAAKMMSILDHEIDITMAMTGCRSLADITPDLLF